MCWQEPAQQTQAGQPVAAESGATPAAAPPVQHGQHARQSAVQHPQPAH
jgi:hypothetical protein